MPEQRLLSVRRAEPAARDPRSLREVAARSVPAPHRRELSKYDVANMVKADLIHRAMAATTPKSPAAQDAVEALFESVASALARGDRVVLRRFGVFYAGPRKTGVGRNPRTGDPVSIPRGRAVRFRPATDLRNLPGSS